MNWRYSYDMKGMVPCCAEPQAASVRVNPWCLHFWRHNKSMCMKVMCELWMQTWQTFFICQSSIGAVSNVSAKKKKHKKTWSSETSSYMRKENLFDLLELTVFGPDTGLITIALCQLSCCYLQLNRAGQEAWGNVGEICVSDPPAAGCDGFVDICQRTAWQYPWKFCMACISSHRSLVNQNLFGTSSWFLQVFANAWIKCPPMHRITKCVKVNSSTFQVLAMTCHSAAKHNKLHLTSGISPVDRSGRQKRKSAWFMMFWPKRYIDKCGKGQTQPCLVLILAHPKILSRTFNM